MQEAADTVVIPRALFQLMLDALMTTDRTGDTQVLSYYMEDIAAILKDLRLEAHDA